MKTTERLPFYVEMYLDYLNNYLTVSAFASANRITNEVADDVIEKGRKMYLQLFN